MASQVWDISPRCDRSMPWLLLLARNSLQCQRCCAADGVTLVIGGGVMGYGPLMGLNSIQITDESQCDRCNVSYISSTVMKQYVDQRLNGSVVANLR
jgi:hypothetical protein